MRPSVRIGLVAIGLVTLGYGVACVATGLYESTAEPLFVTDIPPRAVGPRDTHVEEHRDRESSVSWIAVGLAATGLTLVIAVSRPRELEASL